MQKHMRIYCEQIMTAPEAIAANIWMTRLLIASTSATAEIASLFSAGSAFYRASGQSKFPTKISVISNAINVAGNALFIYGFK